jgi:hypothetical protein
VYIINLGLVAVQVLHISTGAAKFDPMGMIPALILAALFFLEDSRFKLDTSYKKAELNFGLIRL